MSVVVSKILNYIKPYNTTILICFLLLVFGVIAYSVYTKSSLLKQVKFKDVANANQNADRIEFYYFAADWCPHCKNAEPEWDKFVKTNDGKTVTNRSGGSVKIKCTKKDCSDTSVADSIKDEYDVTSYPTIKVYIDGDKKNPIDYDAKITSERLGEFLSELT